MNKKGLFGIVAYTITIPRTAPVHIFLPQPGSWHSFYPISDKTRLMTRMYSSQVTKKLLLRFVLDSIDYRKKCLHLQKIISRGKVSDAWRQTLAAFLDNPLKNFSPKAFSKN